LKYFANEAYGLSWALGVFISPLMAKTKNVKMIPCTGAILMSLGLILASFSTSVLVASIFGLMIALPSVPDTGDSIWRRGRGGVLPCNHTDTITLQFPPWTRAGDCFVGRRIRRTCSCAVNESAHKLDRYQMDITMVRNTEFRYNISDWVYSAK